SHNVGYCANWADVTFTSYWHLEDIRAGVLPPPYTSSVAAVQQCIDKHGTPVSALISCELSPVPDQPVFLPPSLPSLPATASAPSLLSTFCIRCCLGGQIFAGAPLSTIDPSTLTNTAMRKRVFHYVFHVTPRP